MTTTTPDGGVFTITVNGTWCGASATAVNGAFTPISVPGAGTVVGYRAGKVTCEGTCGAAEAHMCSNEEIFRSAQLGLIPPSPSAVLYWFAGGAYSYYSPSSGSSRDCLGWTSSASTEWGANLIVDSGGPGGGQRIRPDISACNSTYKIACCL